ncbi:hypothetical protein HanLR1_Chr07g0248611 [Helianthus annuus]|nr:hypothetical protein HanLR1_Chr07g0248611 [Helianthus annuus]
MATVSMHLGRATRMVMWFHMATVSTQPWRIYPLCLIVYKSEPHNRFITSTTVLVYTCYVLTGHVFIFIYIFFWHLIGGLYSRVSNRFGVYSSRKS